MPWSPFPVFPRILVTTFFLKIPEDTVAVIGHISQMTPRCQPEAGHALLRSPWSEH
ncbi:hypothetical protein LEP1GSC203_0195 [Leptospira terpstrae serovar Hualin str. LT 11-33 = ATCC 700639]|uniref:Uncharacterized protein n=1 Tax=Leptospira terpstrae serovar Hualin str. LT 11-33 = ATCC 700639 TaxID=1257025 RepID=N1VRQ5_9LEPT|nr:hypothetical protein LEP1GSC203_0195 [Leptospira terpstrae serovar Hualin str. LT 11-33 = ATCC 700639]